MGYNFYMTLKIFEGRPALRLVSPAEPSVFEAAVAEFYDRTITAAWCVATALYPDDVRRASDAVVEAYRTAWFTDGRDQNSLLRALVVGFRAKDDPVPA